MRYVRNGRMVAESGVRQKEFAKASNSLWAIGEFRNYVADHIYPQTKRP